MDVSSYEWYICLLRLAVALFLTHTYTITCHPSPTISGSHSMLCLCIFFVAGVYYSKLSASTLFHCIYLSLLWSITYFSPVTNAEDGLFTTNQLVFVFVFVCFCRMQIMHSCVFAGEPISMAANQFKKKKKEGKLFKKNDRNK